MNPTTKSIATLLKESANLFGISSNVVNDKTILLAFDNMKVEFMLFDDRYEFRMPLGKVLEGSEEKTISDAIAKTLLDASANSELPLAIDDRGILFIVGKRSNLQNASDAEIRRSIEEDLLRITQLRKELTLKLQLSLSELSVPITSGDDVIGVLNFEYSAPHSFTDEDKEILTTFANQAAIALQATGQIKYSSPSQSIVLVPENIDGPTELSPAFLEKVVAPYLNAISDLQTIIDKVLERPPTHISIKSISANSPINVNLDGAAEATEVVRDMVVPWRRQHSKTMSQVEEQEKRIQIESAKADIHEKRARAQKDRIDAKRIEAETSPEKTQAEVERMRLENEKLRLEIEEARINLALKILEKLAPELDEAQRILYAMQLLKPLGILTESPLLLSSKPE
ncbi:GAF domain-containing protein [Candidatus Leptofilum sp.]|uniref:GAF domain-containing protein n=1 Tax=Candidatus Leptofilum sp. TaxID=3241576 RepID=UPI003B5CE60B